MIASTSSSSRHPSGRASSRWKMSVEPSQPLPRGSYIISHIQRRRTEETREKAGKTPRTACSVEIWPASAVSSAPNRRLAMCASSGLSSWWAESRLRKRANAEALRRGAPSGLRRKVSRLRPLPSAGTSLAAEAAVERSLPRKSLQPYGSPAASSASRYSCICGDGGAASWCSYSRSMATTCACSRASLAAIAAICSASSCAFTFARLALRTSRDSATLIRTGGRPSGGAGGAVVGGGLSGLTQRAEGISSGDASRADETASGSSLALLARSLDAANGGSVCNFLLKPPVTLPLRILSRVRAETGAIPRSST
mmetsp:Transcript_53437/g.106277  ORF Transcript_53437/g.106277 Transcript_53437/m.106277 type:complete len:312 (-) Transcript_53437:257-1192(-)